MKKGFKLRKYQEEAVEQGVWAINKFDNNSLLVLPTGAGKSLVIGGIAERLRRDILILQPSKEILEQNKKKLEMYVPSDEIGVYSASFKRKDIRKYNFATIQSVYKVPELFEHVELVLVDECHQVNPKNSKGMFTSFLKNIGNPVTIGLTASPFRNVTGVANVGGVITYGTVLKLINRMNPRMWNRVAYNINNHELVEQEYLCPLKYYSRTFIPHAQIPLNKSRSDFNLEEFETMLTPYEEQIMVSINGARKHRKAVLVFCSSVGQAQRLAATMTKAACVDGKTPIKERDQIIEDFRTGELEVVFNVGVLTTGFDFPELDTIYLIRPTRSLALYYQMLGRGVRIAKGKTECMVLDYSGSFDNLGRIEDIKLVKENLWELYANGTKAHGKEIFSWVAK
jgi:DNA repair protein RadD